NEAGGACRFLLAQQHDDGGGDEPTETQEAGLDNPPRAGIAGGGAGEKESRTGEQQRAPDAHEREDRSGREHPHLDQRLPGQQRSSGGPPDDVREPGLQVLGNEEEHDRDLDPKSDRKDDEQKLHRQASFAHFNLGRGGPAHGPRSSAMPLTARRRPAVVSSIPSVHRGDNRVLNRYSQPPPQAMNKVRLGPDSSRSGRGGDVDADDPCAADAPQIAVPVGSVAGNGKPSACGRPRRRAVDRGSSGGSGWGGFHAGGGPLRR